MKKEKHRKIYKYNLENELVDTFDTIIEASRDAGVTQNTMRSNIERKTCHQQLFYYSRTDKFKVPKKKKNHNPLIGRGNAEGRRTGSSDDYFREMSLSNNEGFNFDEEDF